jgi:hypothetical protein
MQTPTATRQFLRGAGTAVYWLMVDGSQRAISGKAISTKIKMTCATMNGVTPRKIV